MLLVAVIGYTGRYHSSGDDLERRLALGATLALYATLDFMLMPPARTGSVSLGDYLQLLAYGVLLVGAWHAIRAAEFGRAVAEERARLAREIHDGLAQYLFAVATHATCSNPAPTGHERKRLEEAAQAAQQEARYAFLALSSAAGRSPFDAALRRYVEFLTADGELDVELAIDPKIMLRPDEQIEIFRIVQEGLANARKHAGATTARVEIGRRGGSGSLPCGTTARASSRGRTAPGRGSRTCANARRRSAAACRCGRRRAAGRPSRSSSAPEPSRVRHPLHVSRLTIRLLGGFEAAVDGSPLPAGAWRLRKARELVKLLALAPGRACTGSRRWTCSGASNPRPPRRTTSTRRFMPPGAHSERTCSRSADEIVSLAERVEVDVDEFELAAGQAENARTAAAYRAALELYAGRAVAGEPLRRLGGGGTRPAGRPHARLTASPRGARARHRVTTTAHRRELVHRTRARARRAPARS